MTGKLQNNYSLLSRVFYSRTSGQDNITSDDFRGLELEDFLDGDNSSKISNFFRYLSTTGQIVPTGKSVASEIPSNHNRRIAIWKWSKDTRKTHSHCDSCVLF